MSHVCTNNKIILVLHSLAMSLEQFTYIVFKKNDIPLKSNRQFCKLKCKPYDKT